MRFLAASVAFVVVQSAFVMAQPANVAPEPGKVISEYWHTATIAGQRAGYSQFTIREIDNNGQKILRATRKLSLTIQRFGETARIESVSGSDETPDGKVLGVFMRQGLAQNVDLTLRGVVQQLQEPGQPNAFQLHVVADGKMKFDKTIAWDPATLGLLGENQLFTNNKPQPGKEMDYLIYEPVVNSIVKIHGKAEKYEHIDVPGLAKDDTLLRVNLVPGEIGGVTLPGTISWFDNKYQLVRSETTMPGLGRMVFERATKVKALEPCVGPDLGMRQSIRVARGIEAPQGASEVVYRLRINDKDPSSTLSRDNRQAVQLAPNGQVVLTVHPVRQPSDATKDSPAPDKEFTTSNNFINSDDDEVKKHASAAVGRETDPWKQAQRIESWVHKNMKAVNFSEAMAPAAEVARTLQGDCTEYAMLAAAMARAVNIPSRTAIGLVYVDGRQGMPPMFAFHMWTEVWVRGQWLALDATLGQGYVGAGHIKVTDHSWHDTATMTPLLPVMRFMMAQPTIEVLSEKTSETIGMPSPTQSTSSNGQLQ